MSLRLQKIQGARLVNANLFIKNSEGHWRCTICPQHKFVPLSRAAQHEDTATHVYAVRRLDQPPPSSPDLLPQPLADALSDELLEGTPTPPASPVLSGPFGPNQPEGIARNLPDLLSHRPHLSPVHGPALPDDNDDQIYDDWAGELAQNRPSNPEEDNESYDFIFSEENDISEPLSDGPISNCAPSEPDILLGHDDSLRDTQEAQAPDTVPIPSTNDDWWCWRNKEECLLDIMGAFPRSLFSEMELKATRWFAKKNGVPDLPTVKNVKKQRENVVEVAGISSTTVEGKLGHLYTVNDWKKIIEHEFANPLVRPHLTFYPEDSGTRLEEARQGERWRNELDANIACPMARGHDGRDYFVEEPCMASVDELGTVAPVMPMRWFLRKGNLWAAVHRLRLTRGGDAYVIDGTSEGSLELPLQAFFLSVKELEEHDTQQRYGLPAPNHIAGILRTNDPRTPLDYWSRPHINPWRKLAAGKRVYALPLWMYCDDTSGNVSKKWNKHNSILFTLAGLPREYVQMLYNIHFIATSNIAPPLEMMESVVSMLKEARKDGIEVWDCVHHELVLVVPWVLAFQGDNPMSSEFASHIGMGGKYFCRVCHVRGADEKNRAPGVAGEIKQLSDYLKAGIPRSKVDTQADLEEQLDRVLEGAPSSVDAMATETGSKDKYFQFFVDKLAVECARLKAEHKNSQAPLGTTKTKELQRKLRELRNELPDDLFNPVLGIPDFDPNSDSPVEVLHVVLLGVVKYWWRDAVSRQTSKGKEELKTRLSSLDVAGLNIPRLRGHTLVQYAGSLVGRDFRVILQVAPAVLQGLIPEAHYEGWLALCRLAPLVFQPVIEDLPSYLEKLENAVDDFLAATALWTTQWFNKPKFHLFVHLCRHIRRFGPAILYATESFESYNLVIRLRSVHSSKHAPSLDIARSFAHLHAVRHLVSGGYVFRDQDGSSIWPPRQAGQGVRELLNDPEFLEFMCMDGLQKYSKAGYYTLLSQDARISWNESMARKAGAPLMVNSVHSDVLRCQHLILGNGDRATLKKYILYEKTHNSLVLNAGRIEEILVDPENKRLLGVLVTECDIGDEVKPYRYPKCSLIPNRYAFVAFEALNCAINTIHNCAANHCTITQTKTVIQERRVTEQREDEYTHSTQPDDVLINLAQMRNAREVQKFQPVTRYPNLPRADMIERAIENRRTLERDVEEKKKKKEVSKEKGKAKAKQKTKESSNAIETNESSSKRRVEDATDHTTTTSASKRVRASQSDSHAQVLEGGTSHVPYMPFAQYAPPPHGLAWPSAHIGNTPVNPNQMQSTYLPSQQHPPSQAYSPYYSPSYSMHAYPAYYQTTPAHAAYPPNPSVAAHQTNVTVSTAGSTSSHNGRAGASSSEIDSEDMLDNARDDGYMGRLED